MICINNPDRLKTEESIVKYIKSTFLDENYQMENNWKVCFKHSYSCLEHPAYQEKRKELQKNVTTYQFITVICVILFLCIRLLCLEIF